MSEGVSVEAAVSRVFSARARTEVYSSSSLSLGIGACCLCPFTHITGGPLFPTGPVGDRGVKGLLDRRKPSGELASRQLVARMAKSGESYVSDTRAPLVKPRP